MCGRDHMQRMLSDASDSLAVSGLMAYDIASCPRHADPCAGDAGGDSLDQA